MAILYVLVKRSQNILFSYIILKRECDTCVKEIGEKWYHKNVMMINPVESIYDSLLSDIMS